MDTVADERARVALFGLLSVTVNVSNDSAVSSVTGTLMVPEVSPAAIVSVPEVVV